MIWVSRYIGPFCIFQQQEIMIWRTSSPVISKFNQMIQLSLTSSATVCINYLILRSSCQLSAICLDTSSFLWHTSTSCATGFPRVPPGKSWIFLSVKEWERWCNFTKRQQMWCWYRYPTVTAKLWADPILIRYCCGARMSSSSLLSARYVWASKMRVICCLHVPAVYLSALRLIRV